MFNSKKIIWASEKLSKLSPEIPVETSRQFMISMQKRRSQSRAFAQVFQGLRSIRWADPYTHMQCGLYSSRRSLGAHSISGAKMFFLLAFVSFVKFSLFFNKSSQGLMNLLRFSEGFDAHRGQTRTRPGRSLRVHSTWGVQNSFLQNFEGKLGDMYSCHRACVSSRSLLSRYSSQVL